MRSRVLACAAVLGAFTTTLALAQTAQDLRFRKERDERDRFYGNWARSAAPSYGAQQLSSSLNKLDRAIAEYEAAKSAEAAEANRKAAEWNRRDLEEMRRIYAARSKPMTHEEAADAGNPAALAYVGIKQLQGSSEFPKDPKKGLARLNQAAEKGQVEAMLWLSSLHDTGDYGVPKNEKLGGLWAARAAIAGRPDHISSAIVDLADGTNPPKEPMHLDLYKKALAIGLAQNEPVAELMMGYHLADGALGEKNGQRAIALLSKQVAETPHAAYRIGHVYFRGMPDVPKDPAKAKEYWLKAAEAGSLWARFDYIRYGLDAKSGLGVDIPKAMDYADKILSDKDADAETKAKVGLAVAHCFSPNSKRCGVPPNPKMFAMGMRTAADNGSVLGLWETALNYGRGIGVDQDRKIALQYFAKLATEKNNAKGYFQVYYYLREGWGAEQNMPLAIDYLVKAADLGHLEAAEIVAENVDTIRQYPSPAKNPRWDKATADRKLAFAKTEEARDPYRFLWEEWDLRWFKENGKVPGQKS